MEPVTVVCVAMGVMWALINFSWEDFLFIAAIVAIIKAIYSYTGETIACVFLLGIAYYFYEVFKALQKKWKEGWKEKVVNFIWENEEYRAKL